MRKVRAQIQELHRNASPDEQNKMILGVGRRVAELTVKGMAMDPVAMETVVRAALREPRNGPMALTNSIQGMFDVRRKDLAETTVDLGRVSLAFALDDFDPSDATKLYGEPLLLNALDVVEFLGQAQDYFVPKAPLFHDCLTVVRKVPKSAGLLPSVRAIEHLRTKGRQPTEQEIDDAVAYHVGDYQRRRALLIA